MTQTEAKPVHGAPRPRNVPTDMVPTSPLPCDFSVGDEVVFTNDNGVEFNLVVRGFASEPHVVPGVPDVPPRFVYVFEDAWWFPVRAESLRHRRPAQDRGQSCPDHFPIR